MNCVDLKFRPVPHPGDWDSFQDKSFICHRCEKIYKANSAELYYFPDIDFFFHQHKDGVYYRAFWIGDRGSVHIASTDSKDENVIQMYGIILNGAGDYKLAGGIDDLYASSRKFFQSMRQQNREIVEGTIGIRLL